jgi:peptidoglycan/xylan/chitin deacetylase (PgdA/CDA1 family)
MERTMGNLNKVANVDKKFKKSGNLFGKLLTLLSIFVVIFLLVFLFSPSTLSSLGFSVFSNQKNNPVVDLPKIQTPNSIPFLYPSKTEVKWDNLELLEFSNNLSNIKIPIFMYHSIDTFQSISPKDANPTLARGMRIPPDLLRKHVKFLKASGYTGITFEDLLSYKNNEFKIPKKSVILSFDDGWQDNYNAYSILKEENFIGSFGIITGIIDKPGRLNKEQLKEMHDNKMELVSHTVNHPALASQSDVKIKSELLESKDYLEKIIGKKMKTIIYPTGSYNTKVIEIAKSLGYELGATTLGYSEAGGQNLVKPFELTRIRVECSIPNKSTPRSEECPGSGSWFYKTL